MTKINLWINILFLLIAILFCAISQCLAALSDKQLCYDPNCSEIISLAKTVIAYRANDREVMSFDVNADVKVFSKGAGKRTDLWGVEIGGKRGFAPKSFLNEYKVLQRVLLHEVPVRKFNNEAEKVYTKLKSPEIIHKAHSPLENKLSHDDNDASSSKKSVDTIVQEDEVINADSISPSYEVIDGTTLHYTTEQPNFVNEAVHATALPNEQTLLNINPAVDFDNNGDKDTLANDNELQAEISSTRPEGIKLPPDTNKGISTKELLEDLEATAGSTLDTMTKDDALLLHENSRSEDDELSKNVVHEELMNSNSEKNVEQQKKEKVTETIEAEGIIAALRKRLTILSNIQETAFATGTTNQNNNDIPVSEVIAEGDLQLQTSNNIEVKNVVTEENIVTTQAEFDSNTGSTFINKNEIKVQQENIHENNINEKTSEERVLEEEVSTIVLENATFPSDVPSSNSFVYEDANKPAKHVPTASSVNDNFASLETDVNNNVKNIQIQETSKEEENIEMTGNGDTVASLTGESINSFHLPVKKIATTQSSNDISQAVSESNGTYEDIKKGTTYQETITQIDEVTPTDKVLEINSLPAIKEELGSATTDLLPDSHTAGEDVATTDETLKHNTADFQINDEVTVHNVNKDDNLVNDASFGNVLVEPNKFSNNIETAIHEQSVNSSQENIISEQILTSNVLPHNRDLLNIEKDRQYPVENQVDGSVEDEILSEHGNDISNEKHVLNEISNNENIKEDNNLKEPGSKPISDEIKVSDEVCSLDHGCITNEDIVEPVVLGQELESQSEEDNMVNLIKLHYDYWKTLIYLSVTAFTILVFTLGYYYIENIRRDRQFIARINELEKELLVSKKEYEGLLNIHENLKFEKLQHSEDELLDSNEMILSLKADLEVSQNTKAELEDQVTILEKDLEGATEAGLELERMLREVLSSNNEVNPLAQSVEDLQARLDAQQTANESLTNALNLKAQEIEILSADLVSAKKKGEMFEVKLLQVQDDLTNQRNLNNNIEETLTNKIHQLEVQIDELSNEKALLHKELRGKELEAKELVAVISQLDSNELDLKKFYDVSHVKIEAIQLREERDELKIRLNDVEGAHQLLEEHMKLIKEEVAALSDQCKIAEKEKNDAETRLEVLSKFFKEKEAERQKEEAIWLEKQGEVVSTVERIHTMQNEIQNYKQQIEMLKREIVDQEREYKNQISALETKAHEQWVAARQNERRLEESKAEAGQLRNRLTLVEKNLNDADSEAKLHRLEANGETTTSPPLFIGAESSSSPIMFSGSSGVPPLPPSYLHCFPSYLPPLPPTVSNLPPYDISQRPPPLGGRLSSPPPMPLHPPASSKYENTGSPPPPMSPHLLPPFNHHRSPPPPFGDHIPPPPPGSILPPPLGTKHPWGEESLPPLRNSGFHPHQREQRARNHKGSLHSSGESLDKVHHGKV